MDKDELIQDLKAILDKEQELYTMCTRVAEEAEDADIKELLGRIAHEEYSHISIVMDNYQRCVDQQDRP